VEGIVIPNTQSRMYECEADTRSHASLLKPLTYAHYASTPDVFALYFIDCYAQCHCYFTEHKFTGLDLECMISITFISMLM